MSESKIRVLLADDHRIFRDGIGSMLQDVTDILLIGMASNGLEAMELLVQKTPDVLILDLSMPDMNGFEVMRQIRNRESKPGILILSMHHEQAWVKEALVLGALGYISKEDTEKEELLEAIRAVAAGNTYFGPAVQQAIQSRKTEADAGHITMNEPGLEVLSKRETEILRKVMEGMSNQEIADALFVSIRTVETHKNNLMTKLNLRNTVELVKYAIRKKFFEI